MSLNDSVHGIYVEFVSLKSVPYWNDALSFQ